MSNISKKRFLPPSKKEEDFSVQSANNFLGHDHDFLHHLAQYMETGSPTTTPRRPTPFSALWQFAADLEGKTSEASQKSARRRLRGILALLALRSREGIALSCKVSPPFNEAANGIPVVDMMRRHIIRRSADIVKDSRVIYLTLGEQVIAGYSPSTLLFPAAKRLSFLPNICPKWYIQQLGEWLDPTDGSSQLNGSEVKIIDPDSIPQNAGAIRVWLDYIITWMASPTPELQKILPDINLLKNELVRWRKDLDAIQPVGEISESPLLIQGVSTPEVTAFLKTLAPFSFTLKGTPVSSLTLHNGRFLLSKSHLTNPNVQLFGNINGNPDYDFRWENAPVSGAHLGEALNLPSNERDSLRFPFLFVDKLFTPSLSCLSDKVSGHKTNNKWRSLSSDREAYAYPLGVSAFEFFSTSEIEDSLSFKSDEIQQQVSISFQLGNFLYVKNYAIALHGASPIETLDPSLDFRLFPDYDLCDLTDREKQLPAEEDQCYHARIRMSKALITIENGITPIFEDGDKVELASNVDFDRVKKGDLTMKSPEISGSGSRLVLTIRPGIKRLCGFDLGGKGLLMLRLDKPKSPQGRSPHTAIVGIDFGTSNTCLSTLVGQDEARILIPDALTTSFLDGFSPAQRDGSHEGYSADFDFFATGTANRKLFSGSFFPTQLASRNQFLAGNFGDVGNENKFDHLLSLICFESLSDIFRKDLVKIHTVANYDSKEESIREQDSKKRGYEATVHLKDRLKWDAENVTDTAFFRSLRRIFLQHLRLQLVHATAKKGAFISTVRASYPRAFTPFQRDTFLSSLRTIWNHDHTPDIKIFTESHAAAAYLRTEVRTDHFLVDIGGGTTDICVFSDGSLKMECSIRLAADVVDRYFLSENAYDLREHFFDACQSNGGTSDLKKAVLDDLKKRFLAIQMRDEDFESEVAMVPRGLFYSLLSLSRESPLEKLSLIYRSLNENHEAFNKSSVEHFFTTLAVFYGGLAYLSGLMLKDKVAAGDMTGRGVKISFAGNGANHLSWLRINNESAVDKFLGSMFRAGSGLPDAVSSSVDILNDPKASVALGLVSNNINSALEKTTESAVYDRVDGDWNNTTVQNLYRLYTMDDPTEGWDFDKSEIKCFLQSLSRATPQGKIGSRSITARLEQDWTTCIVTDERDKNRMNQSVSKRINKSKKTFADELKKTNANLALEPVIVAELSGLLDLLRTGQNNAPEA